MNWENERYVRLYVRDTGEWNMLSWDAQALFMQLLRKVDRAGVLQLGKHGLRVLPAVINHKDKADIITKALAELLEDGCVQASVEFLVIPNFLEAQEATQSDRVRQQESRARRRDKAMNLSQIVTESHNESHNVTSGHGSSQVVTPSEPSVLNQTNLPSPCENEGFPPLLRNSDFIPTWETLCAAVPELKPVRRHSDRMGGEISTGLPGPLHNALVADWGALLKSDPPPSKKDFQVLADWLRAGGLHYLTRTEWAAYICKNLPAAMDKAAMWDKGGRANPAAKVQPPPSVRVPSKAPALDPAVVAIRERMRLLDDPEEQAKIAALLAASEDS